MSFREAIRAVFGKYAVISGRAARPEFWWWALFIALGNVAFAALDGAVFRGDDTRVFGAVFRGDDTRVFGALFGLATVLPTLCVGGRRLHDRDMSAWWLLLWLVPVAGGALLLYTCAREGTRGENSFGPDPRGRRGGGPARSSLGGGRTP